MPYDNSNVIEFSYYFMVHAWPYDIYSVIISPNKVFGDIMVLASPHPLPVDPADVNALIKKIPS